MAMKKAIYAAVAILLFGCVENDSTKPSFEEYAEKDSERQTFQVKLDGISVVLPKTTNWQLLKKSTDKILLGKPTERCTAHTLRASISVYRDSIILNFNDFDKSEIAKIVVEKLFPPSSERFAPPEGTFSEATFNGADCMIFDFNTEDYKVPKFPNKTFIIEGKAHICLHPEKLSSFISNIVTSQRYMKGEVALSLNREFSSLLQGIEFISLEGDTPLLKAVRNANISSARQLIQRGADIDEPGGVSDWGKTALIEASFRGDINMVKMLIDAGADLDAQDSYGDTALMVCAGFGQVDIANLLVKAGANVDAQKPNETTALMIASRIGDLEIVKLLLEAKANPNLGYGSGPTALDLAKREGHSKIIEKLQEAGAK